jgi:hypothetical protein
MVQFYLFILSLKTWQDVLLDQWSQSVTAAIINWHQEAATTVRVAFYTAEKPLSRNKNL